MCRRKPNVSRTANNSVPKWVRCPKETQGPVNPRTHTIVATTVVDVSGRQTVAVNIEDEMTMTAAPHTVDLNGGFYTVSEAVRLLGSDNAQSIVRWFQPTASGGEPVILRQYQKLGREHELSFLDLLEVRFVEHFRKQKISLQALRTAAKNARKELGVSHPFATSNVKFQTDRKQVFLETAKETGTDFSSI